MVREPHSDTVAAPTSPERIRLVATSRSAARPATPRSGAACDAGTTRAVAASGVRGERPTNQQSLLDNGT